MDPHDAQMLQSLTRLETEVRGMRGDVKHVKMLTTKRLDAHGSSILSLEKSRAWGRGRDWGLGVLVASVLAYFGLR